MTTKVPLLCWSGGFDSTALLIKHLEDGIVPDTFYAATDVIGSAKYDMEMRRRRLILRKLANRYKVEILDTVITIKREVGTKEHSIYSERYNWTLPEQRIKCRYLPQPLEWFHNAMTLIIPHRHSCLEIAYVNNDSTIMHHSNLRTAWSELLEVTRLDHTKELWDIQKVDVPLMFPLLMYPKTSLLHIYSDHFDILKLVWVCEKPLVVTPNLSASCKKCKPCITHQHYVVNTPLYKEILEKRGLYKPLVERYDDTYHTEEALTSDPEPEPIDFSIEIDDVKELDNA